MVHMSFGLPRAARISLAIHDVRGRKVCDLIGDATRGPGFVSGIDWDGRDNFGLRAPSGVYFARLLVDGRVFERRLVLTR
jgi:hypothetical protein